MRAVGVCTPLCEIVRAAATLSSVPISSTITTSGVWFCTASIRTWCCSSGAGTACAAQARARVRDVAVAAKHGAGVHDDDAAEGRLGEVPGDLADRGRLSHPGAPEEQHGGARVDEVADEIRAAGDGSADATGEPDDAPRAVANDGDAMQGAVDPRAVIPPDLPDVLQRALDVRVVQDVLG